MIGKNLACGLVLLAAATVPAWAFQESTVTTPAQPSAPVQIAPLPNGGVGLQAPDLGNKSGTGTEVRIPGLGKLGVLPKLDFGLEILYGTPEDARRLQEVPSSQRNGEDGQVLGRFKHQF